MIFLGCLFNRDDETRLLKLCKNGLPNAVNTYQWTLIDGLNQNIDAPISIYNVLPVGTFPQQFKKFYLPTKKWTYCGSHNVEIGCINLPFIKQFVRFVKIKQLLYRAGDKEILIYSTYLPFLKAVQKLDSSYRVTLIVTDLPEFYDLRQVSRLHRWFRIKNNCKISAYLKRIDSFVLLTEQMKAPLNVGERPYVVVEGICGTKTSLPLQPILKKKVILYTGTLHYQFGIRRLLEAFSLIDDSSYELWICGAGEAEKEICSCAERDNRIHFFGYVTKAETIRLQQQATLLVNPRSNEGEYTKYSFPSKTMEYMASGVPVVMYKLDGIPNEYDDYLFYVDGCLAQGLKDKIVEVCSLNQKIRCEIGIKMKNFVFEQKNEFAQAKQIIELNRSE